MAHRSSTPPPSSGPRAPEVRSLGTLAALLVTCRHPEPLRISANVTVTEQAVRLTWCSVCGALSTEQGQGFTWQRSGLVVYAGKPMFEELSQILHAIRNALAALSSPLPRASAGLEPLIRHLREAFGELQTTGLALDLDRLDDLIARIDEAPSLPTTE